MSETPNLDRFLRCREFWEEYAQLSDDIIKLEGKLRAGNYSLSIYSGQRVSDSYPVSERSDFSQLALEGAITSLRVRKTELASILRNTFHLEV